MTKEEVVKSREYQRSNAACKYADSIAQHDDRKTYCIEDFEAGAEWADKNTDINFAFLTGFEAAQEEIISKLQSLIEEWKLHDSSEAKYRLEAYKELLESIEDYGNYTHCMGRIRICNKVGDTPQSETAKTNTFFHELTHSILRTMGELELNDNEKFVTTFSAFLTEAIKTMEG